MQRRFFGDAVRGAYPFGFPSPSSRALKGDRFGVYPAKIMRVIK
jgi:hypothetical protein